MVHINWNDHRTTASALESGEGQRQGVPKQCEQQKSRIGLVSPVATGFMTEFGPLFGF